MKGLFKFFILCLAMATAVTASAQLQQIKTVSGRLIPYGSIATTVTTDSTLRVIDSIVVVNNTGGILEVTVVGSSTAGDAITGKQIFRYKKASGTITLSSATNILATVVDAGLGTATFSVSTTASGNIQVRVKGKDGTSVRWRSVIQPYRAQ